MNHALRTILASSLVCLTALCHSGGVRADTRPNILFIMTDDHASHALSCYGSRINRTPNLDRIAKSGMRFDHCFVTNSICGPARATILTGKYSHKNGYFRNERNFDGAQETFPKLLQKAGYQTAIVGKWHLGSDPTGFDHWEILIGQGPYFNPPLKSAAGTTRYEGYTTEILTDRALEFLSKSRDTSKPFLLLYQHKAPHREWQPPPQYRTLFDDVAIPEPKTLFDDYAGRGKAARVQAMTVAGHLSELDLKLIPPRNLTPGQLEEWHKHYDALNEAWKSQTPTAVDSTRRNYQRYIKDYLRAVQSVDDNVGRVLDYLESSGLAKNTMVIYTSDQGFFLGDHGWYDKRWMYEESLRAPLLVSWPGVVAPGSVNRDMVLNLDFAETMLEAAGVAVPADMQGRSLLPLLQGRTPADWRTSMYYRYYEYPGPHDVRQHYGVRTQKHKLFFVPDFAEWELYDLERDPDELTNVYADPAYAAVVVELKAELKRLQEQYQDDGRGVVDESATKTGAAKTRKTVRPKQGKAR